MKLRELKDILDSMSDEELNEDMVYNSDNNYISGFVYDFKRSEKDLYHSGEDDPSTLVTRDYLINDLSYDEEDLEGFDLVIPKGSYYFEL